MIDPQDSPILSELDDDPDLWEFAGQFIDKMPDLLERINAAVSQARIDHLKQTTKNFRNAAVHGGFTPLADQAAHITQLITADESEQIQSAVDQLNQLCKRTPSC